MGRKAGSGLHNETAAAVEELVARIFEGQSFDVAAERVDRDYDSGRGRVRSSQLIGPLHRVAEHLGLSVARAVTPDLDHLSDVRLELVDGSDVLIEVKAQTTARFGMLGNADWVRDETDVLRFLLVEDEEFRALMPGWMRDALAVPDAGTYFGGWDLASLWVADLALLPNRGRRTVAGVRTPADLGSFLTRKYLLHVTSEGVQVVRLDSIPFVQDALAGEDVHALIRPGGRSSATVWMSTREPPARGRFAFAYYVGYESGVIGRHKLKDAAIQDAPGRLRIDYPS